MIPIFKELIRVANDLKALFDLLLEGKDNTGFILKGQ